MDLTLLVGIPRSGKSTLGQAMQKDGWVRICPDDIRVALTGREHFPAAEPMVWATAETMTRALLIGEQDVVIDATNISKFRRRQWIELAREFNITPRLLVLNTPLEVCLARNKDAGRQVPEEVIERMHRNFETPTEKEGEVHMILSWAYQPRRCTCLFDRRGNPLRGEAE